MVSTGASLILGAQRTATYPENEVSVVPLAPGAGTEGDVVAAGAAAINRPLDQNCTEGPVSEAVVRAGNLPVCGRQRVPKHDVLGGERGICALNGVGARAATARVSE